MIDAGLIQRDTTSHVIGAFYDVYNALGFGFLEHVYSLALERELVARGRLVGREVSIPIIYKGDVLTSQRVDMIVDEKVVVEIKSTYVLPPTAKRQTLNYLRSTNLEVALLLHFGPDARFHRLVQSTHVSAVIRGIREIRVPISRGIQPTCRTGNPAACPSLPETCPRRSVDAYRGWCPTSSENCGSSLRERHHQLFPFAKRARCPGFNAKYSLRSRKACSFSPRIV